MMSWGMIARVLKENSGEGRERAGEGRYKK